MASGENLIVLTPSASVLAQSVTTTPRPDSRNDHPVLDFDAAADNELDFPIILPRNYGGGGVTVTIIWSAATATTGVTRWGLQWERHPDDTFDLDADGFATANTVDATTASASGEVAYDTITFTDGAQIDSIAVGESGRLRFQRVGSHANDTMAGDAELHRIEIRET